MFSGIHRRLGDERGQAVLELAFVLPLMLLLILLFLDIGVAMDRRASILQGMREAGRAGAAGATAAEVADMAINQSDGVLDPGDVTVCHIDGPDVGSYPGDVEDAVRISISHEYSLVMGQELLAALGSAFPPLEISPTAEAALHEESVGAVACP